MEEGGRGVSDIVERLRNWRSVHLARLHLLMEEAADEMERLSRTGSNDAKTDDDAAESPWQGKKVPERDRLTDAEREAVEVAAAAYADDHGERFAATLRGLLERLK
jgi:hypothetical protein